MIEITLRNGLIAMIDDVDAVLAPFPWRHLTNYRRANRPTYARRTVKCGGRELTLLLHREVMERVIGRPLSRGECPDHKNGNGLDCRRDNLRLASYGQNAHAAQLMPAGTTGFRGVSATRYGRYKAQIRVAGATIHLGTFRDPETAHDAYVEASIDHFGSFSPFYGDD